MLDKALGREQELWSPKLYKFLPNGTEISSDQRDEAVRWLIFLRSKFSFLPETLELAIYVVDKILQTVKVRVKHMKVLGVTALYVAAKTLQEDNTIPATLELVRESQCGCSVAEVHRMELLILSKLNWDLRHPSALAFLNLFQAHLLTNSPDLFKGLANMSAVRQRVLLTEKLLSCLAKHTSMQFKPSTLALAVFSLELELFDADWFNHTVFLESIIKAENDDLMVCREQLSTFELHRNSGASAYRRSYAAALTSSATQTGAGGSGSKLSAKRKSETDDRHLFDTIKRLYGEDESALQAVRAGALCSVEIAGHGGRSLAHQQPVSVK